MEIYHQTGHNYKWNLDSYSEGIGDGLIFSPINIDSEILLCRIDQKVKDSSFLDPQLYFLNEEKGCIESYPYFPGNLKPNFSTEDLDSEKIDIAQSCIKYQLDNGFKYLIIPTKYFLENPTNYLDLCTNLFIDPFCQILNSLSTKKRVLLTILVKTIMITDETKRDEILNWITSHQYIDGVYLIFENSFTTKQIKDFNFLFNALRFIRILKENKLEVHIGYNNTEGFLYSIAMPDSVTMGSYENLRSFDIKRFQESDLGRKHSPSARLYSAKLLQWIEYGYVQSMKQLVPDFRSFFEESKYNPIDLKPEPDWQFKQTEPYKHFFFVFYYQIKKLPEEQLDRIDVVLHIIRNAISLFNRIGESGILLDENSDGSHLPFWYNALLSFKKELTS